MPKKSPAKEFRGQLPVGLDVVFYPKGNLNADVRSKLGPCAAKVCWCDENGMADLHVFHRDGTIRLHGQVYPWNHRVLIDELGGGPSSNATHYGCWKFTHWSQKQYEAILAEQPAAATTE